MRKAQQIEQSRVAANGPFGRYTARQLLDATDPICQKLLPLSEGLQLVAESRFHYVVKGTVHRFWEVDCLDAKGQEVGYFWWDADTAMLNRFALLSPNAPADPSARLARVAAVGRARYWMEELGWGPGARWQVCRTLQLAEGNWIVLLGNNDPIPRRMRTVIDAKSGIMVSAMPATAN